MRFIRFGDYIINPSLITAIKMEGGSCVVHFAGGTTPPVKLTSSETPLLLGALRSSITL